MKKHEKPEPDSERSQAPRQAADPDGRGTGADGGASETNASGTNASEADASAPARENPALENPAQAGSDPAAALTTERDRLHNQLQRTLADLQNFRKRRTQEMADARRSAIEALVGEMLPVLDNFHLATDLGGRDDALDPVTKSMRDGLLMVRSLLEGVFERHGVTEIRAAGEKFDPAVHEAVGIDPDPDAEEGVVTQVVQRGYRIDDRILRPSRVMVGGALKTTGSDEED